MSDQKINPGQYVDRLGLQKVRSQKHLNQIAEKTGLHEDWLILIGVGVVFSFLALTGFGRSIIFNIIAVLYPAYKSMKALSTSDVEDDKRWLTYWVIYGFFMTMDPALAIVADIFPYFKIVKLIFFIWVMHGSTNGYLQVFHYVIGPLISQFDSDIQQAIEQTQTLTQKIGAQAQKTGQKLLDQGIKDAFTTDQVNKDAAKSKIDEKLSQLEEETNVVGK